MDLADCWQEGYFGRAILEVSGPQRAMEAGFISSAAVFNPPLGTQWLNNYILKRTGTNVTERRTCWDIQDRCRWLEPRKREGLYGDRGGRLSGKK